MGFLSDLDFGTKNGDGKFGDFLSNISEEDGILSTVLDLGEKILNIGGISADQKKSNKTEKALHGHLVDAGIDFPSNVSAAHIMHGYNHDQKQKSEDAAMLVGAVDRWGKQAADFFSNKIKTNVIRGDAAILGGQVKEWVKDYVQKYDPEAPKEQQPEKQQPKDQPSTGGRVVGPSVPVDNPKSHDKQPAPRTGGSGGSNGSKSETLILGMKQTHFYIAVAVAAVAVIAGVFFYMQKQKML